MPVIKKLQSTEENRLENQGNGPIPEWQKWGPYVSERSWGTVREDYSKNGKIVDNILWSVNLNKSFYCLLMLHQHDEMFKVKDLNKLLRFYIKRKVTYYKHFLVDEPNIEFIVKLPSKNLIIFAETIRNIRDNNE